MAFRLVKLCTAGADSPLQEAAWDEANTEGCGRPRIQQTCQPESKGGSQGALSGDFALLGDCLEAPMPHK
jgi:hypothetical protein